MKTFPPSRLKIHLPRLAAVALACLAASLQAAERYWLDTIGIALFNNTGNWSTTSGGAFGASVPVAADTANFDLAGTYTVDFNGFSPTNANLDIEAGTLIFDLAGQTYMVNGLIRIAVSLGSTARLTLFDGTLDVDSAGDNIEIGTAGVDGFLTVSTDATIGAGGTNPDILIGNSGDGTFTINNGGVVNSVTGQFGLGNSLSTGTATVTGLGSQWNNSGAFAVGSSGTGMLTVQSGATISGSGSQIGSGGGSIGSVTVTGAGSSWVEAASLSVGNFGNGALTISSGGEVTVGANGFIAGQGNSFGTVSVSGTGSRCAFGTTLTVGNLGHGTLAVSSGGKVTCGPLIVGDNNSSSTEGIVTITGTNSSLTATGVADIGNDAAGSLTVSNGGALVTLAGLDIGNAPGGVGEVTVTGANATWTNTGTVNVSNIGTGTLTVSNGGAVTTGALSVNDPAGTPVGTLNFDGGSITTTNFTRATGGVFNWRGGTLRVDGGTFNNSGAALVLNGAGAGDLPRLQLAGNSATSGFDPTTLTVGSNHAGALELSSSASLTVLNLLIGSLDGGDGTVTVSGNDAILTAGNALAVGGVQALTGGTGTLNISDGGTVATNTFQIWAGGTVNLDGGTLQIFTFDSDAGEFNFNSGTVHFTGGSSGGLTSKYDALLGFEHRLTAGKTISYDLNFSFTAMSLIVDGGTFNVATGLTVFTNSILEVRSGNITAGNMINNATGQVVLMGGSVALGTTFINSGEIRLAATSDFSLITGTTLTSAGLIHGNGQVGMSLVNNSGGQVRVGATERMVFTGASTNNGTGRFEINPGGDLQFTSTLGNNSLVDVIGGTFRVQGATANAASTGLIAGRDAVMWFDGGLTNGGSLALGSGVNDIFGDITNSAGGRIIVSGGAVAIFYDDITNSGTINVSAAGPLASAAVFFGALSGSGVAGTGAVFIEGDARPGASPGVMSFGGDVSFGPLARTVIEVGGPAPGTQYDRVTVLGSASLGGTLEVQLINGFVPSAGQTFDVLDTGAQIGAFTSVDLPKLPVGLFWRTERLYTDGTITVCLNPGTFAEYAAFHGLGGLTADDDGDGESNALEFLLGQNPQIATQAGSPTGDYNGNTFTFEFEMPDLPAVNAVYHIESSTDLAAWTPRATRIGLGPWTGSAAGAITLTPLGDCLENVSLALAPGGAPQFFVRLRGEVFP